MVVSKKVLFISFLLLFLVLGIFYGVGIFVRVPYTAYVTYTNTEYYNDEECYYEYLVYNTDTSLDRKCMNYEEECTREETYCVEENIWGNCMEYTTHCISQDTNCVKYKYTGTVLVENDDLVYGQFKVTLSWMEDEIITQEEDQIISISAGDEDEATFVYYPSDINSIVQFSTDVVPSGKEICDNVVKERPIQKEKEEVRTMPLFQRIGWEELVPASYENEW